MHYLQDPKCRRPYRLSLFFLPSPLSSSTSISCVDMGERDKKDTPEERKRKREKKDFRDLPAKRILSANTLDARAKEVEE